MRVFSAVGVLRHSKFIFLILTLKVRRRIVRMVPAFACTLKLEGTNNAVPVYRVVVIFLDRNAKFASCDQQLGSRYMFCVKD